jgi:hypothetical protein
MFLLAPRRACPRIREGGRRMPGAQVVELARHYDQKALMLRRAYFVALDAALGDVCTDDNELCGEW